MTGSSYIGTIARRGRLTLPLAAWLLACTPPGPPSSDGTETTGGYEIVAETNDLITTLEIQDLCADLDVIWPDILNNNADIPLLFRRPAVPMSNGQWPNQRLPVWLFTHGNGGQDGAAYDHIWDEFVPLGFIAIQNWPVRKSYPPEPI